MAWSDIFLPSGAMTYDESAANIAAQEARLRTQTDARLAAGTITQAQADANYALAGQSLDSQNSAAAGGFFSGLTDVFTGNTASGSSGPGLGALFKDVFIVAIIGGAIWLFVSFGGFAFLKGYSKTKYGVWVIIGGALLVVWGLWAALKKTSTDASGVVSNVFTNPLKTLFG